MLIHKKFLFIICLLVPLLGNAQTMSMKDEFSKKIKAANTIDSLGDNLFGNNTSESTGKTAFENIDISLAGNSSLPVQFGRRLDIDHRYTPEELGGLGNWDIDVPYIEGTFSKRTGWAVISPTAPNRFNRCTSALPPAIEVARFTPEEVWHGYRVHVPGVLDETMLAEKDAYPDPSDGQSYPWILKSMGRLGCLPALKNGAQGEGYFLKTSNGTKYYFDYPVERWASTLYKAQKGVPGYFIERKRIFLLATRIEDRFGNYVNYDYVNGRLASISANDGRRIDINYSAISGTIPSGVITVTAHGKSWSYTLQNGQLLEVKQPDGSSWKYSAFGSYTSIVQADPTQELEPLSYFSPETFCLDNYDTRYTGNLSLNVTHPSGASGQFNFEGTHFYRSQVPYFCMIDFFDHQVRVNVNDMRTNIATRSGINWAQVFQDLDADNDGDIEGSELNNLGKAIEAATITPLPVEDLPSPFDHVTGNARIQTPNYFALFSLKKLSVTGAGMGVQSTNYNYLSEGQEYCGMYDSQTGLAYGVKCGLPDPCPEFDCDAGSARTVEKTLPTGEKIRKRFGTIYAKNEGKLLSEEVLNIAGAVVKRVDYRYMQDNEVASQPFKGEVGVSFTPDPNDVKIRPLLAVRTRQDGVDFNSTVGSFNNFAQPTSTTKSSSLGYTATDSIVYENNLTNWVLGQVKSITNVNTNKVVSETTYDATTALPIASSSFGLPQGSTTYNTDGTIASIKDASKSLASFTSYKRGIPQNITFADSTSITAVVNDSGLLSSVTNQLGATTNYQYDAMGRLTREDYPSGDTNAWAPSTFGFSVLTATNWIPPGLSAGHWIQSSIKGNYRRFTYFDAMLRPVLTHEYDEADLTNTLRQTINRYDSQGRLVFSSYPRNPNLEGWLDINATSIKGVHTEYDTLGRVTKVKQDSELGQLTTTTEYLPGFQTKVTNPKGVQTVQDYQVFDSPDTSRPVRTIYALGATESKVSVANRDVFGKVTYTQIKAKPYQYLGRSYVFDAHERLCKVVAPETGATHYEYDINSNIIRTVEGDQNYTDASCNAANIALTEKTVHTYDNMNRLTSVDVPGGSNGDKTYLHEADGLIKQINNNTNGVTTINRYFYNKRRMLTKEDSEQVGWYNWSLAYGYDNSGALSRTTYPMGLFVDYMPNALGQPTQAASTHGTWATGVQYYPNGAVKQFTYGNGIVHTMVQNARQLPIQSRDALGNTAIIDFSTVFDANGNVTNYNDYAQNGRANRAMQYDALDRLKQAYAPNLWGTAEYQYDIYDNLKRSTLGLAGFTYNYDAKNRLSRVDRDAGGSYNYTYNSKGAVLDDGRNAYALEASGRINEIHLTGMAGYKEGYRYDGNNRRVLAWIPRGGSIISMYGQSGQLFFQVNERESKNLEYIFLGDDLIASREVAWGTSDYKSKYQHTDALGSPVATTDQAGNVVERTEYAPYGAPFNRPVSGVGYTGHVMDQSTGLVYAQQRYYDPMMGRFLSNDPVGTNPNNGSNFNRYAYANNNPYLFVDPDGEAGEHFAADHQTRLRLGGSAGVNFGAKFNAPLFGKVSLSLGSVEFSATDRPADGPESRIYEYKVSGPNIEALKIKLSTPTETTKYDSQFNPIGNRERTKAKASGPVIKFLEYLGWKPEDKIEDFLEPKMESKSKHEYGGGVGFTFSLIQKLERVPLKTKPREEVEIPDLPAHLKE
jgi:RHS repeat-associated protein